MNIKKGIIFTAIFVSAGSLFAQTGNIKKAQTNYQKYYEVKQAGTPQLGASYISAAKEAIDAAVVHEKTKESAEAWAIYSLVYGNLGADNNDADLLAKAKDAIATARGLDKEKKNEENLKNSEHNLYAYNFNKGVGAWEKQDFTTAYNSFNDALNFMPGDTTLTYYAGIAAVQNKDYEKGLAKYISLIDRKDYSEHKKIVKDIPNLYLSLNDTTNAIKYAGMAAKMYPDDNEIANQNINYNIALGNTNGILDELKSQIEKEPTNKTLYFYLGIAEASLNNNQKAFEAYKKALEIDPNYLDANINAGVTLINTIKDELQVLNSNKTLSNSQYNTKIGELKEKVKPAEQFFLKVVEAEPKNESGLKGLKSVYDFLQLEDKSKEVQAKLDALN
ncbi:tetratricopeptide repeat protein [Sphingobacterium bovistauri]|uniref:Tetratricopeptide repeat protein n=1 Tax=Sphingobacterium bovistauri TaxID=2781959 RepID=A0ABS7Z9Z3_9SPHI|nr:tetratricopeptide repeat protein [Sphingobacterium bovistauri]MCA5005534.1 tetratricopeptide repeat protein [Sphingobacterium bovistauri]